MSLERCKLGEKDSIPWYGKIGHICADCYYEIKNNNDSVNSVPRNCVICSHSLLSGWDGQLDVHWIMCNNKSCEAYHNFIILIWAGINGLDYIGLYCTL